MGPAVQPWSLSEALPQSTDFTFGHAGDASQLKDVQAQLQANIHRPVPVVVIDVQGRFLKKFVTPQSWDPWAPGSLLGCQVAHPPTSRLTPPIPPIPPPTYPTNPPTHPPIHPPAPPPLRHWPTGPLTGPPTQLASNCPVDILTTHPVMLAERQRQRNAAEHRAHAASGTWQKEEEEDGGGGGGGGGGGDGSHRTSAAVGRSAPSLVAKAMQHVPPAARAPCWARPVLALASIGGAGARSQDGLGLARPECPKPSTAAHAAARRPRDTSAGAGLPSGPQRRSLLASWMPRRGCGIALVPAQGRLRHCAWPYTHPHWQHHRAPPHVP